jgi:hypothetical protein
VPLPEPEPEPRLRTPDPNRFRDPEEFQDRDRIADPEAFDYQKAIATMERESGRQRSSGSRPAIVVALALVLAGLVSGFMYYSSGPSERGIAASRMQEAPAAAPEASRPTATAPGAPEASPPRAVGDGQAEQKSSEPSPFTQTESLVARASEQPAPAGAAPAQELPPAMQRTAKVPEQQPGGKARLILAVSPRGEIYIDGKHHGTTPPITTLDLEPGMHRIEVRSGSRTPYLTYVTVQAGDVRRIRYDFSASGAVPPARSASWDSSNRLAR